MTTILSLDDLKVMITELEKERENENENMEYVTDDEKNAYNSMMNLLSKLSTDDLIKTVIIEIKSTELFDDYKRVVKIIAGLKKTDIFKEFKKWYRQDNSFLKKMNVSILGVDNRISTIFNNYHFINCFVKYLLINKIDMFSTESLNTFSLVSQFASCIQDMMVCGKEEIVNIKWYKYVKKGDIYFAIEQENMIKDK